MTMSPRLRIEPIAESLRVSNTPVREGLLSLRNEGFVRLVPRRGFVVTDFGREDIRDLYWVASRLAGELAARAARSGCGGHVDQAAAAVRMMDDAVHARDLGAVSGAGHDFHRHINLAAGSARLAAMLRSVVNNLPLRLYGSIEAQLGDTVDAHRLIHRAVANGDADGAGALMADHILSGAERLIVALESRGVWGQAPEGTKGHGS